jgi:hypothetical protein
MNFPADGCILNFLDFGDEECHSLLILFVSGWW